MLRMIFTLSCLLAAASLSASPWTYRGSLQDGGKPAEGRYDLRLTLLNDSGTTTVVGPITRFGVEVKNGQFATDVDFALNLTTATKMKLRTEVAAMGSSFVTLGQLQAFDPDGVAPGVCWGTQGNAGTNEATDFLGTTDAQSLHFRVNNQDIGQLQDSALGLNIRLGSPLNSWSPEVVSSVVLGGAAETNFGNTALKNFATITGGFANAAEDQGTVAGGRNNHAGPQAFVAGGYNCAGGTHSFALGTQARIRPSTSPGATGPQDACNGMTSSGDVDGDNGTLVWADDQPAAFDSSGERQFLIRAGGGFGVNTNSLSSADDVVLKARDGGDADSDLRLTTRNGKTASVFLRDTDGSWAVFGSPTGPNFMTFQNGAHLTAGGAFTNSSSRSLKHDFAAVDAHQVLDKVLALPVMTWQYNASKEGPHMGPVAEDFHAAFGLGDSDRSISTIDADGVALAAIQGLAQKLETENAELRDRNTSLLTRIEAIEQRLSSAPANQ